MSKGVKKIERLPLESEEGEGTREKQKGHEDSVVRRWKWADGIKFKRSGLYGGDRLEIILILLVF